MRKEASDLSARQPRFTRQPWRRLGCEVHVFHSVKVFQKGVLKAMDIKLHGSRSGRDFVRLGIAFIGHCFHPARHLCSALPTLLGDTSSSSARPSLRIPSSLTPWVSPTFAACIAFAAVASTSLLDAISGARERGSVLVWGVVLALPLEWQYTVSACHASSYSQRVSVSACHASS